MCEFKVYKKKYLDILNENYVIKGNYLKRLIYEDVIIDESIHRKVSYEKFYNFIKNSVNKRFVFNYRQLLDFFPLNSVEYKVLKKSYAYNINLDIAVCDFNNGNDVYDALKFFVNNPSDNLVQEIYSSTCEDKEPCTYEINPNKILIFLSQEFEFDDLRHEFIHFLQYIKNDYTLNSEIKSFEYLSVNDQIFIEEHFGIDFELIMYFTDLAEYDPLLNEFFDELREFKAEYYNDMDDLEFARFIYGMIFRKKLETSMQYLERLNSYEYSHKFNTLGFKLLIYFNLLRYKMVNMKNLLFGYFNKSLKPKY